MEKKLTAHRLIGVAALAMMFGAASVNAQSTSSAQGSSGSSAQSSGASSDKSAKGGQLSKAEQNMMRDMAYSNISEVAAAKLALEKSQSDQVKAYAQKMIDDHTQAQTELEKLAQAKGVTLPTEPDTKHKAAAKAMSALQGEKFDKMYMAQAGNRDHQNTHKLLMKAQKEAKDPDLKAHVAKVMPIVDQHLVMAKDLNSKKNSVAGGSMGPAGNSSTSTTTGGSSGSSAGATGATGSSGPGGSGTASGAASPTTPPSPGAVGNAGASGVTGTAGGTSGSTSGSGVTGTGGTASGK